MQGWADLCTGCGFLRWRAFCTNKANFLQGILNQLYRVYLAVTFFFAEFVKELCGGPWDSWRKAGLALAGNLCLFASTVARRALGSGCWALVEGLETIEE